MNEQNRNSPKAEWLKFHKGKTGPELVDVTATDVQEHEALVQEEPKPSLSLFARLIVAAARIFAGVLMFFIWTVVVGPIWLAMLMRAISSYSAASVLALFSHATPPNPRRLDATAELWPNGYRRIAVLMTRKEMPQTQVVPFNSLRALRETVLAIFFYTGLATTVYISVAVHTALFSPTYTYTPPSSPATGSNQPPRWTNPNR